jgi:predicted phosphodiesterase
MRVAALYDIHGNLPALEAVLAALAPMAIDTIVVGGDVLPGPMPTECLDCLAAIETPVVYIAGNGERDTLTRADGGPSRVPAAYLPMMQWVAAQLSPAHRDAIARWPATHTLTLGAFGAVEFCHATPDSDTIICTQDTPDDRMATLFSASSAATVVCGHTHMAYDRMIGARRIVNAGSVGMPFGAPGAHWLFLDGVTVRRQHTMYDVDAAAARVRATAYPGAAEFAQHAIVSPPSEESMRARYANH